MEGRLESLGEQKRGSSDLLQISRMSEEDISVVKLIEIENDLAAWSLSDYQAEIERNDSVAIVAKYEKETVGFLVARPITSCGDGECELYNVGVKKQFQNEGVGQALLNALVSQVVPRKVRFVWLEVRRTNLSAMRFYKRNGFEKSGERKNFYRFPVEDADILRLDLFSQTDLIKKRFVG